MDSKNLYVLTKYGFEVETETEGLYNLIDKDFYFSKLSCVPYRFRNFSKDNLTETQLEKYTQYVASKILLPHS